MEKKIRKQLKAEKIDLPIKQQPNIKPILDQATETINTSNQQNTNSLNGESVYGTVNSVTNENLPNIYETPNTNTISDLGSIDTTIPTKTVDNSLSNINGIPTEKSNETLENINGIPTNKINEPLPNIYNTPNQKQQLGNLNVNDPVENIPGPTTIPNLDM